MSENALQNQIYIALIVSMCSFVWKHVVKNHYCVLAVGLKPPYGNHLIDGYDDSERKPMVNYDIMHLR